MLAKRVSGISGKDVEEREGNGKRCPEMSYLCTCEGAGMEAGQSQGKQRQPDKQVLQQHPEHSLEGSPTGSASLAYCLTKNKMRMKKIKWSTVRKVLEIIATIITTIAGTIAVQSCMG